MRHLWVPACLRALLKYIVFSTELWRSDETDSTSYQYIVLFSHVFRKGVGIPPRSERDAIIFVRVWKTHL